MAEVGNRIVRHHLLLIFKRPSSKAFQRAVDVLAPAAEAGNHLAMRELANLLITSGQEAEGERWLRELARSGNSSGSLLLGVHYLGQQKPEQAEEAFAAGRGRRPWPAVLSFGRLLARRRRKDRPIVDE